MNNSIRGYVTTCLRQKARTIFKLIDVSSGTPMLVQLIVDSRTNNLNGQFIVAESVLEDLTSVSNSQRNYTCVQTAIRVQTDVVNLPFELCELKFKGSLRTELENRYHSLKLMRNQIKFRTISKVINAIRCSLSSRNFIEIQTPKIMGYGSEGGSEVFGLNYFGTKAYLAQSPQLYKQQVVLSGFEKVFETNYVYRAQTSNTTRHTTEAYCIDVEMHTTGSSEDEGLLRIENQAKTVVSIAHRLVKTSEPTFRTISYIEALALLQTTAHALKWGEDLQKEHISYIVDLYSVDYLLIDYFPMVLRPLYILRKNKDVSFGFDLYNKEIQLCSGGQRENKYDTLIGNCRQKNIEPTSLMPYLVAFKNKTISHGGFSIGFSRLMMGLLGLDNIRDAILFPRDPSILVP
jgi:aspartyl/asparaginyl-tRNA synthetase